MESIRNLIYRQQPDTAQEQAEMDADMRQLD